VSFHLGLFHRAIILSGSFLAPWAMGQNVGDASLEIAKEVGCSLSSSAEIVNCLQSVDTINIDAARYKVINNYYAGTNVFGPVVDDYLPIHEQYISSSPWRTEWTALKNISIITGFSSNDGILMISGLMNCIKGLNPCHKTVRFIRLN